MNRVGVLRTAELAISGPREADYGEPEDNFRMVADLWNAAFGTAFTATDIPMAMILLKVARQSTGGGSQDTWIDIAGYAALGAEVSA